MSSARATQEPLRGSRTERDLRFEAVRAVTAGAMLVTAVMKMTGGYHVGYILPGWAYWILSIVELAIAVGLFSCARFAAWMVVAVASVGMVLALLFPERPCGCLGAMITLNARAHLMAAGTLGMCGLLILVWHPVPVARIAASGSSPK